MRAVVQLVSSAAVRVGEKIIGRIGGGLVVFLGVHRQDSAKDVAYLAEKIVNLRIFADDDGLMNRSLLESGGEILVVSQFTLFGDCRKGRRPSYGTAALPEKAEELYDLFIAALKNFGVSVATGEFRAMMDVSLVNSGPVTMLIDSTRLF
jgi:D-tyrosyl-tRNA(Tyr) deacylase